MPHALTEGQQASAISRLVVKTMTDQVGRGPQGARTSISRDVITVVLDLAVTIAEQTLLDGGFAELVFTTRRALQQTMAPSLKEGVEEITGRAVRALLSDTSTEPHLATQTFVLEPLIVS